MMAVIQLSQLLMLAASVAADERDHEREMLPEALLKRKAVVYVRQSTQTQVQTNLERQRRINVSFWTHPADKPVESPLDPESHVGLRFFSST
jgi:DNA invertase Pin-like site-specific DNA recombinase